MDVPVREAILRAVHATVLVQNDPEAQDSDAVQALAAAIQQLGIVVYCLNAANPLEVEVSDKLLHNKKVPQKYRDALFELQFDEESEEES